MRALPIQCFALCTAIKGLPASKFSKKKKKNAYTTIKVKLKEKG